MSSVWLHPVVLRGRGLTLSPLTKAEAAEIVAIAADRGEEVFEHLRVDPPRTIAAAEQYIATLNAPADQLPFAQRINATGELVGSTSFYEIDPTLRALAIGHTWIARRHWRSWVNTESKLIMLSRAFDELGAERVVWHTDILNTRSRAAIARLGAQQEGILRHHRIRKDGSWRDTVQFSMISAEWPAARDRLRGLLDRYSRLDNGQPDNVQPDNGQPDNGQPDNGQPDNGRPEHGDEDHRSPTTTERTA